MGDDCNSIWSRIGYGRGLWHSMPAVQEIMGSGSARGMPCTQRFAGSDEIDGG